MGKSKRRINTVSRDFVRMLGDEVERKLKRFYMQHSMQDGGCLRRYNDRGPRGENPPIIAYAAMTRSRVYTGTRGRGSFNHHSQLSCHSDRYLIEVVEWSHED